jgi:hypothetical protein
VAACRETSSRALDFEMLDMQFLLTVIDALERKAQGAAGTFRTLSNYTMCDGEANARLAACALGNTTPPFQADEAELKQIILWQLGNGLCP